MRAPAAPTSRTGLLPPPSSVYLSKLQNVFVCQAILICSDLMLQANKKILFSDSGSHICSFLGNVLRTLTQEKLNQFKYEFVAYQVFVQH